MKKNIFRVGVDIEEEFTEFATCTSIESAEKAKQLLEGAGWDDVEIRESNLYLDTIEIDGKEIDLTQ